MNEFQIKIIRSDDKVFNIDDEQYLIETITGVDGTEITNYFENYATADGGSWGTSQVKGRQFSFSATSKTGFSKDLDRKIIGSFFQPKYEYKIYVTIYGITKWCWGILNRFNSPLLDYYAETDFTVVFDKGRLEPNSTPDTLYWRDVDNFSKDVASVESLFGHPHYDQADIGFAYDVFNFAQIVEIENNGDVETTFIAIVSAKGTVENPSITKDNNSIRINDTLVNGDIYELNFITGSVTKNGKNAITKVDRFADFGRMFVQPNSTARIHYTADTGANALSVQLFYDQLYGSVL